MITFFLISGFVGLYLAKYRHLSFGEYMSLYKNNSPGDVIRGDVKKSEVPSEKINGNDYRFCTSCRSWNQATSKYVLGVERPFEGKYG